MARKKEISQVHLRALAATPTRKDERRVLILDAVLRILSKDGVDELTFERVGIEAGMARSHVAYYFEDRNSLIMAAMRFAAFSAAAIIEERVAEGTSWDDCIRRYVDANFDWVEENPTHATVYALLYYLARLQPKYRALHTEIRAAGTERIAGLLEKGPLSGNKKNIQSLAKSIQALITGNLIDALSTNNSSVKDRRKETQERVENWIRQEI